MENPKNDKVIADRLVQLMDIQFKTMELLQELVAILHGTYDLDFVELPNSKLSCKEGGCETVSTNNIPHVNQSTLSIGWKGKSCFLGNTLAFKLFSRLSRRPNQFIGLDELQEHVWEGFRSKEAIRSVVKELRRKLGKACMEDLAAFIDGHNKGYYGLILNRVH